MHLVLDSYREKLTSLVIESSSESFDNALDSVEQKYSA